jgi:hypothetical protein
MPSDETIGALERLRRSRAELGSRSACYAIFCGLLLVFADLEVGPRERRFDLLVDALGYAFVAHGAHQLARFSPHFSTARAAALASASVWLVWVVLQATAVGPWLAELRHCTDIGIGWFLLLGVASFARAQAEPRLARLADVLRIASLALVLVAYALRLPLGTRELRADSLVGIGLLTVGCALCELWRILQCATLTQRPARFRVDGSAADRARAPAG